jgi:hypothetical protein
LSETFVDGSEEESLLNREKVTLMTRRLARHAVFIENSRVMMIVNEVGKRGVNHIVPQRDVGLNDILANSDGMFGSCLLFWVRNGV